MNRARLRLVVGLALTGVLAYNLLFFSGLQHLPGNVPLIVAFNPIFVAIASSVLSGHRLSARAWGGVSVSLVGALLVISRGHFADLALTFGLGESMILGCCLAWCAYTLMGRQVAATGLSSLGATTWSALFGALFLFLPALFEGQLAQFPWQAWPMQLAMLHLGGLATAVALLVCRWCEAYWRDKNCVFTNFVPVSAVMIGVLLLAEPFHWSMLVGGVLVLGGIWLAIALSVGFATAFFVFEVFFFVCRFSMKHSPAGLLQAISVPSISSTGNLARVVRLAQCITGARLAMVSLLGADDVSSTNNDAAFSAQDIADIGQYAILHHTPVIRSGPQCVQHPDYPILSAGMVRRMAVAQPRRVFGGGVMSGRYRCLTLSETQKEAMADLVALAETEFLLQDVDETQSDLLLKLNRQRHNLIDPLLRVWNRRGIMELLERKIKYSRRERRQLTLAYIDLDHFKRINDCFGHPVGDIVLQAVTQCIREMIRGYDLVGRIGGENSGHFPECRRGVRTKNCRENFGGCSKSDVPLL